jgi:hypothetical protein
LKPGLLCALALAALTSSARIYIPSHPKALAHPAQIVQPSILWGHAFAESDFESAPKHINPIDQGMFGLHETAEIHAERAKKWGEYEARDPVQAWRIAAHVMAENLAAFDSLDMGVTAYRWGQAGARKHGVDQVYVARVMQNGL